MPTLLWGAVGYNTQQKAWYVKGSFQGERLYYSGYKTAIGWKKCETEKEAQQLQLFISAEIEQGIFNPLRYKKSRPNHIKNYVVGWIEKIQQELSFSTFKAYRAAARYIVDGLGDIYIEDLNYKNIKAWLSNLDLDMKTKKNYQGVLIRLLKEALKDGDISQLPQFVEWTGALKIPSKNKEWIDATIQEEILNEINLADSYIFRFLFCTGVRVSEARALRKCDIFKDRGYISIRNTFAPVRGGEELKPVKQKKDRNIKFYDSLLLWWDDIPVNPSSEFVFNCSKTGKPYTKNINRDIWNPACMKSIGYVFPLNRAGRASFAQQLLNKGVDSKTVANALGHSDLGKTLERNYADPSMLVTGRIIDGAFKK